MNTFGKKISRSCWFIPLLFAFFLILSMLPLYAAKPFPPQDTSNVIAALLSVSDRPYQSVAFVFHLATAFIAALLIWQPGKWGKLAAGYIGVNYLTMILTCAMGQTEQYGFVVMTGALLLYGLLGALWIVVALRGEGPSAFRRPHIWEWGFVLLALVAFWAPYSVEAGMIRPDFNPLLLLISPDFGMMFCFTTPVFLLGMILSYPRVNNLAFRITAINGLIYGLFNISHYFYPERVWMGVLHLPLQLISLYALLYPSIAKRLETATSE